jgi:hypothetical protein
MAARRTATQMFEPLYRAGAFAAYQITLAVGIALMPLALLARRLGVTIPLGDLVAAAGRVYDGVRR